MDKKRLVIIDSNAVLHRAFHALPRLTTKKGELVNAIFGFLLVFFKLIKEFQPDYIAACFDFPAPTFRHERYKEYKITRIPAPEEFYQQIPKLKEILKLFKVQIFEEKGFEADDIIGTISYLAPKENPQIETIILSGDLDELQCINKQTKVYLLRKGVKETILYDINKVKERYGLLPSQISDLKALEGDQSDNIPGVPGIGEKTAIDLLRIFRNISNLYKELEENTEEVGKLKPKLREILKERKEQVFLNQSLTEIKKDAPIDFGFKKCQWGNFDKGKIIEIFKDNQFNSLIKRLPEITNKKSDGENLKLW